MNTKCLNFTCPLCKVEYEIFLKEIPYLMFMDCPHCHEHLSCFEGQIRIAKEELLAEIKTAKSYSDVKTTILKYDNIDKKHSIDLSDKSISYDDVINLKIDLQLCETVEDVLKVINGNNKK